LKLHYHVPYLSTTPSGSQKMRVYGSRIPIIPPGHDVPSIAQLRYHIRKHYTKRKQLIAREGEVTFNRDFRPLLGSETRKANGPGQIFEVDATVADVYLVSSSDPTVTWLLDYMLVSRAHLGLE
jgi:hypothetical protein